MNTEEYPGAKLEKGRLSRPRATLALGCPGLWGTDRQTPLCVEAWTHLFSPLCPGIPGPLGRRCQARPSLEGAAAIVFLGEKDCFSPGPSALGPGWEEREKLQRL